MEVQLKDVPNDGISSVRYSPFLENASLLMVSSWDSVRRYPHQKENENDR